MYKLRKKICASSAMLDSKYSLTPSQICQLLSEITQLRGLTIMAEESPEGDLQFVLGEDVYTFFDTMSESVRGDNARAMSFIVLLNREHPRH